MNLYEKYKSVQHPLINPFTDVLQRSNLAEVRVTLHTPLNKAVGFAMSKLRKSDVIVLVSHCDATEASRKCARVLQRKFDGLHQCDASTHQVNEDIWVPKDPASKLDSLSVRRHVSFNFILLAKGELPNELRDHRKRIEVTRNRTRKNTKD